MVACDPWSGEAARAAGRQAGAAWALPACSSSLHGFRCAPATQPQLVLAVASWARCRCSAWQPRCMASRLASILSSPAPPPPLPCSAPGPPGGPPHPDLHVPAQQPRRQPLRPPAGPGAHRGPGPGQGGGAATAHAAMQATAHAAMPWLWVVGACLCGGGARVLRCRGRGWLRTCLCGCGCGCAVTMGLGCTVALNGKEVGAPGGRGSKPRARLLQHGAQGLAARGRLAAMHS